MCPSARRCCFSSLASPPMPAKAFPMTVKFGGWPPPLMWERVTQGPGVLEHKDHLYHRWLYC